MHGMIVFNATVDNISAISYRSVLLPKYLKKSFRRGTRSLIDASQTTYDYGHGGPL